MFGPIGAYCIEYAAYYEICGTYSQSSYSETCLQRPPNGILLCLLEHIWVAKGHLDELQKAEIFSKSKLVPSVFIKIQYWINHR